MLTSLFNRIAEATGLSAIAEKQSVIAQKQVMITDKQAVIEDQLTAIQSVLAALVAEPKVQPRTIDAQQEFATLRGLVANDLNGLQNSVLGPLNVQAAILESIKGLLVDKGVAIAAFEGRSADTQANISRQINLLETQINRLQNSVSAPVNLQAAILESMKGLLIDTGAAIAAFEGRSADTQANISRQINLLETQINGLLNSVSGPVNLQAAILESMKGLLVETGGAIGAFEGRSADAQANVSRQINLLETQINELQNLVLGPVNSQGALLLSLRDLILRVETAVGAIGGGLATPLHQVSQTIAELKVELNKTQNAILSPVNSQGALLQGLTDLVLRVEQSVAAAEGRLAGSQSITANRLNAFENSIGDTIKTAIDSGRVHSDRFNNEHLQLLTARGIAALVGRAGKPITGTVAIVPPGPTLPLKGQISQFSAVAPLNIDTWLRTFNAGTRQGAETAEGTLSHEGHVGAAYFRMFVNVHARGRMLDAGCGALPLPQYLADWPVDQLAGFDPIPAPEGHPFTYAQTFAENIPWPDGSFETVVIATSLDHVYLLDRALAEIHRVLAPRGRLLLWTAMFDETTPYEPYGKKISPPDTFHLFHPGRNWFYRLFETRYRMIERVETVANAEFIAYERLD